MTDCFSDNIISSKPAKYIAAKNHNNALYLRDLSIQKYKTAASTFISK